MIHAPPQDCCSIGRGVTIGHGAIVHAKRIGDYAGIGMGAILSIRSEIGDPFDSCRGRGGEAGTENSGINNRGG